MAIELVYCASGNAKFARIAVEAGYRYGAKLPHTVYEAVWFADQDWKKPDRQAYMAALARHKPEVATVVDWEHPEQLPEVLSWAEEAAQHVRRVVVIPKVSGMLDAIPERIGGADVILGYSVPTSYGGTEVFVSEFGSRPVHLLGGSPHNQMRMAQYLNVVSCDGNMAHQQAHRCRFWSRRKGANGHWRQLAEVGIDTKDGANAVAFRMSCEEIKAAWSKPQ